MRQLPRPTGNAETVDSEAGLPDLIPVRMLNEYTYCPRLAYLEWVQGEWAENPDTHEGRFSHRRVDIEKGSFPEPGDPRSREEAGEARSILLGAESEGLIARIDLLEFQGSHVIPVDYKKGSGQRLEDVKEPEQVQLCAQGLILRANGYAVDHGIIYFVESKSRVVVPFTPELIRRTRALASEMRAMAARGTIPPPLQDSPKCTRCSLVPICLPDETHFHSSLESGADPAPPRRLLPERDDRVPLYVQEQGTYINKDGERLVITKNREPLAEVRIREISHLCVIGNVQISTQTIRELCSRGIPVCYFSYGGWFTGVTQGHIHKNIDLRVRQFQAVNDEATRLQLARSFVAGKIRNARTLLRRNHPGKPQAALHELDRLRVASTKATNLGTLLGIEGAAARVYFSHFAGMLKGKPATFDFTSRNRRPPRDPVNALLSFVYALLVKETMVALTATGFDPYLGFYHSAKYGRPALALDLMEEFRHLLGDSVVLTLVNGGELRENDFIQRAGTVALTDRGRKRVIEAYQRRIDTSIIHPLYGYRLSYRRVIAVQARLLARAILGELQEYPAFVTR